MFDELIEGKFTISTDSVAKNIMFKYNLRDDVVEAEVEGVKVNLYKPSVQWIQFYTSRRKGW